MYIPFKYIILLRRLVVVIVTLIFTISAMNFCIKGAVHIYTLKHSKVTILVKSTKSSSNKAAGALYKKKPTAPSIITNRKVKEKKLIVSTTVAKYNSRVFDHTKNRDNIFFAVMTSKKFLKTRAKAVYETWGKNVPGKIMFFSGEDSKSDEIPLVSLSGVTDSYPPQKKSMMMLKYINDHYINDYKWFVRCDDDLYVRKERLKAYLKTMPFNKNLYIGQTGGDHSKRKVLGLGKAKYCMGGPGIILSAGTIRKVTPHIKKCLNSTVTKHEDTELGRCIHKYVGINCKLNKMGPNLFYHEYRGENSFSGGLTLNQYHNALTLHPVKTPLTMHRLHSYFMEAN